MSRTKLIIFAVLPTIVLLALGEGGTRVYYYVLYRDAKYLLAPFAGASERGQAVFPYRPERTYTVKSDPCSDREIVFTVNGVGGRGREWEPAKHPGALRILAVGESSTFGVNNPDWATWPMTLDAVLRQRGGPSVEVLNGGQAGMRLDGILERLRMWLPRYRPDVVIYYGAHNDANPVGKRIAEFQAERLIGRLTAWLYYRSMLYTYLIEKLYFATQAWGDRGAAPDIPGFAARLQGLISVVRSHGGVLVLVLQATQVPATAATTALDVDDRQAVKAAILRLAEAAGRPSSRERIHRIRAYRTQVLVDVARRIGAAEGLQVIDPRSPLAATTAPLFCDEIHLTDAGNRVLAEAIADRLVLPPRGGRPAMARP